MFTKREKEKTLNPRATASLTKKNPQLPFDLIWQISGKGRKTIAWIVSEECYRKIFKRPSAKREK